MDTFRLKFYFDGLRLFCDNECFPEPVQIVAHPQTSHLKYHGIMYIRQRLLQVGKTQRAAKFEFTAILWCEYFIEPVVVLPRQGVEVYHRLNFSKL